MNADTVSVGLRIDVDTLRGTKIGVPNLVSILAEHKIQGTFFFSVGPDNMGRHLWRFFRPSFIKKMFRSRALSLYGIDILFKGTFWPGPLIGKLGASEIKLASIKHEIGLHACDHNREQTSIDTVNSEIICHHIERGKEQLETIIDRSITSVAAPSWRVTDRASTGRGEIPNTLPTYDEVIGANGITESNYNKNLLDKICENSFNVLTIHAEVEGICCRRMFDDFLTETQKRNIHIMPLVKLLEDTGKRQENSVIKSTVPGRDGWVSCQGMNEVEV